MKDIDPFIQKNTERFNSLTDKEREVIKLVADGYSNKEIADMTFNSIHTIGTHRKNINDKLSAKNVSGILKFAYIFGLV